MLFLNNVYEEDFPVALLTVGVFENPAFVAVLGAHLILFPRFWLNIYNNMKARFAKN